MNAAPRVLICAGWLLVSLVATPVLAQHGGEPAQAVPSPAAHGQASHGQAQPDPAAGRQAAGGWGFTAPQSAPRGDVAHKPSPAVARPTSGGWGFTSAGSGASPAPSPAKTAAKQNAHATAPAASAGHTTSAPSSRYAERAAGHGPARARIPVIWSRPDHGAVIPKGGIVLAWGSASAGHVAAPIPGDGHTTTRTPVSLTWSPNTTASPDTATRQAPTSVAPPSGAQTGTAGRPSALRAPVEPLRPQPTGLERLSDEWPHAVKVGVQYRGRAEGQRGSVATNGRDDEYYLNRFRLEATVNPSPWFKAFVQAQDAQTLGYDVSTHPTSLTNTLDLRQGYVEFRRPSATTFGVRVGRQEIAFGEQRLVGASDWNNTARSFDAIRAFATQPGVQVDAFVSSVVATDQRGFDRRKPAETFGGVYVALSRLIPKAVVEPFVFVKVQGGAKSEGATVGDAHINTVGVRAVGTLPRHLDYGVEVAAQGGRVVTDSVGAWAGHYVLGWTIPATTFKPRVVAEFNHASGDKNPTDGRRQTFDQLFPTNHSKYGIADQMEWRNMRDAMLGVELSPSRKLKVNADVHRLFLATLADGLYVGAGAPKVLNRQAASRTVGSELDLQGTYAFSKELSFGAGVGMLFAGDYLAESTSATTIWTPYLMWNVKF